jgi:hypothetical protein
MCTQINRPAGYNRGTHRYDQQQMSPAVFLYPHNRLMLRMASVMTIKWILVLCWTWVHGAGPCVVSSANGFVFRPVLSFSSIAGYNITTGGHFLSSLTCLHIVQSICTNRIANRNRLVVILYFEQIIQNKRRVYKYTISIMYITIWTICARYYYVIMYRQQLGRGGFTGRKNYFRRIKKKTE